MLHNKVAHARWRVATAKAWSSRVAALRAAKREPAASDRCPTPGSLSEADVTLQLASSGMDASSLRDRHGGVYDIRYDMGANVANIKTIFIAFAIEDERQRDFLKGQSLSPRAPYEFVDMSVKQPYDTGWKDKVRTRIRRSNGVIVLVSKNSLASTGQKWEIQCAKEEGKRVRGIWAYSDDRTNLAGVDTFVWTDKNISDFIDSV